MPERPSASLQVREAKNTKELLIDQLRELFLELGAAKINTKKQLEQLEGMRTKWEDVKKMAPSVKEELTPIQGREGKRIKADMQQFTDDVNTYARAFRKFAFLKYITGPEASYLALDKEVCVPPSTLCCISL